MQQDQPVYRRILLKLSGEFLQGSLDFGIDLSTTRSLVADLQDLLALNVQMGLVIGGGNFLRGKVLSQTGLDRVTCDQMGMLATVMNGLALHGIFLKEGIRAHIMSPIAIQGFVENYNRYQALRYIEEKAVIIFVGGTGSPLVSTDSAVSLRAIEIDADIILKASKVNGVYSKDPHIYPDAIFYDHLSYQEAIDRQLEIMDMAAFCLCRDHHMPIRVFNMNHPHLLKRIVLGSSEGTLID